MAIYHFSADLISRAKGQSAVAAAAYRHCAKMSIDAEGRDADFSNKRDLAHEEFVIPESAPAWVQQLVAGKTVAQSSEAFWNVVEAFEKRKDAQFAKEMNVALPIELNRDQNIAMVREFVAQEITARGMIADWVYHDVSGNPHVHLMVQLRPLTEDGFGGKKVAVLDRNGEVVRAKSHGKQKGAILYQNWAGDDKVLAQWRASWAAVHNVHLAKHGFDVRIDHRSYREQGIEAIPTTHVGVQAKNIDRTRPNLGLQRIQRFNDRREMMVDRLKLSPKYVLDIVTREKAVFDERDLAKVVIRYTDDKETYDSLMSGILTSPFVVRLDREQIDLETGSRVLSKYTTLGMIRVEATMVRKAERLNRQRGFKVAPKKLEKVFANHSYLSDEQRAAVEHLTDRNRASAIVGFAGAGKTTMLRASREAWEAAGYKVVGSALAGKAAEGLEKEAGIAARTLASWSFSWAKGRDELDRKTIMVLDEAGMVSSRQMAELVAHVAERGAKLVLVGDPEQLQPIEAGAAFRAIADRLGYVELETIRRQEKMWMQLASLDFARQRVGAGLRKYHAHGCVVGKALKAEAMASLVGDWYQDWGGEKTSLILGHLRADVRELNEQARKMLVDAERLEEGLDYTTVDGVRKFAINDQIVFLRNEKSLEVKNGMLGRVTEAKKGRITVALMGASEGRSVEVSQAYYQDIDYGYATTIHKSQGATVDHVKVLATLSLDRHLTYVAMTRHRQSAKIYYGTRSFTKAGGFEQLLSRPRLKETTLDYAETSGYRDALRFAVNRGLYAWRVAQTLLHDHQKWIDLQKARLTVLSQHLASVGMRLWGGAVVAEPLLAGVSQWSATLENAVETKLSGDKALARQWQEIRERFTLIYQDPATAFRAFDFGRLLKDLPRLRERIDAVARDPEVLGALRGKEGFTAGAGDRKARSDALANAPALRRAFYDYMRLRIELVAKATHEETATRERAAIAIPGISEKARTALEQALDQLCAGEPAKALSDLVRDRQVRAELDVVASAVARRFGERAFLQSPEVVKNAIPAITTGISDRGYVAKLEELWPLFHAAQKLYASGLLQTTDRRQEQAIRERQEPRLQR